MKKYERMDNTTQGKFTRELVKAKTEAEANELIEQAREEGIPEDVIFAALEDVAKRKEALAKFIENDEEQAAETNALKNRIEKQWKMNRNPIEEGIYNAVVIEAEIFQTADGRVFLKILYSLTDPASGLVYEEETLYNEKYITTLHRKFCKLFSDYDCGSTIADSIQPAKKEQFPVQVEYKGDYLNITPIVPQQGAELTYRIKL